MSQVNDRAADIESIPQPDLQYLVASGYIQALTQEDRDKAANEVLRLSQLVEKIQNEKEEEDILQSRLDQGQVFSAFHHQGEAERQEQKEDAAQVSAKETEIEALGDNVNALIEKKSSLDRTVPYVGMYVSLTGLGSTILNDLAVRDYRVDDEEFSDFLAELKTTYDELRSIGDRATWYANLIRPAVPEAKGLEADKELYPDDADEISHSLREIQSLLWGTAIGLGKLQGDPNAIGARFTQAYDSLQDFNSSVPNKLMAAEIMTSFSTQDIAGLKSVLVDLDKQLKKQSVPKDLSAGVAATMMAGRRFDGTYPVDRFEQFRQVTTSFEAASILAVMNVPYDQLSAKFQGFSSLFNSWGYMKSEDTEIASAYLAIGELGVDEVQEKLKYIEEQLRNYLGYPLVAAGILASIPVFEAHEVLDLMEKAVTLLSAYSPGLERSEQVALAVRMIHGVRNEIVKEIDSTAPMAATPVQFTYLPRPGMFIWYHPIIIAHTYYHPFTAIGGFHPAHYHGVGGFAG
ncbi:MAG TPA: hypothetical protein VGR56_00685 [Nitrososphaerales archaeon]|nr:hypothetical protein [Nitrososphaerales archaeon]